MTIAETLGQYCAELRFDDLPVEVVDAAKSRLLDAIACALASEGTETHDVISRWSSKLPKGHVSVLGTGGRLSATDASFASGALVHAILQDDANPESGHPGCMIVPAALAACEDADASAETLLLAIVIGYEVMWRGGACGAVLNGSLNRGIRGYVINGSVGSAAAAGRGYGLSTGAAFAHAISCGASFASGILEPIGVASIERSMMAAANARTGVTAALLAASGLRGTPTVLEGGNGYFRAIADVFETPSGVLAGLGESHRILKSATKLYPSGIANQAAIYAAKEFRARHDIDPDRIAAVRIRQFPLFGTALPAYPSVIAQGPYTEVEQALPNKPFAVASMLIYGEFDIHTLKARLRDQRIANLTKKITSRGVEGIKPLECFLEVELNDGTVLEQHVDRSNDAGFFPSVEETATRLHGLAGRYGRDGTTARIADWVASAGKSSKTRDLANLMPITSVEGR